MNGFFRASWDNFQDFPPLANSLRTDTLQRISASYERISTKSFRTVGRSPCTNRLDFGGDPNRDADPGFMNLDHDPDTEISLV